MHKLCVALAMVVALSLGGCGYNTLQSNDEQIKASWAEVVNQYQRRADLIPNLVNTVKGYATHEKDVLTEVTQARAAATSIQVTPEVLNDPAAFAKFQAAQGALSGALSKLLAVSENYPNGGADKNLDYLEVVHVFIRRPHSGGKAVYKARKTHWRDHSAVGLSNKKLS